MTLRARDWLLSLYIASAVFVTVQQGLLGRSNNFRVFRAATTNLLAHRDLYSAHPEQHFDYYKYSPTFAVLFAPFAALPFAPALLVWSLLNSLLLFYALRRLLPARQATLAAALIYLEVLFALQYTQSNGLVTALVLLAFLALERGRDLGAAGAIGVGGFIKLFPFGAAALVVFHPRRRRFVVLATAVVVALAALPLLVIPPREFAAQYRSWWTIELSDAARINRGDSVMQYFHLWLGVDWPNWPVQVVGTIVLLLPLALNRARWGDPMFRLRFLCSLLLYFVLFNHQSERASFVVAYTGLFVWYVVSAPDPLRLGVAVAALGVLLLHDVQILPWEARRVLIHYRIKGLPCLVAWLVMQAELQGWRRWARRSEGPEMGEPDVPPSDPLAHS